MNKKHILTSNQVVKGLTYIALVLLALCIVVPVGWVFLASFKENVEFYGQSPWTLPKSLNFQNFMDAFKVAKMGNYMMNSVVVTILALLFLLVIALPASYVLARYRFKGNSILQVLFMAGLFVNVNYIVVPIFLMFVDADTFLQDFFRPFQRIMRRQLL